MSWKSQGSANRIENNSTLAVNNLIADSFILKDIYRGQWDICGGLMVKDDAVLMGNVLIYRDANIDGNVNIGGALNVLDTNIIGNVYVSENAFVRKDIYMDLSGGTRLHGENRRFGFNMTTPQSTIDISGDLERTIDMHSSLISNKNVVARNNMDRGLTMNIDTDGAYIDFYVDSSINSMENYNARLLCEPGGKFTIDVTNSLQFRPHIIFSEVATDDLIADERIIIYDNSSSDVQYLKDIYDAPYLKTGTAMFLVAGDNSSNVFFRTSTREGRGLTLGGGYFPGNRINGTVALIDASNIKYPALNIVSGPTSGGSIVPKNLRTSVGVNKYDVYQTAGGENQYAMDVNGPVRLAHQEVIVAADVAFQVVETAFFGVIGIAIGTPIQRGDTYEQYFLKTTDGGYTWTSRRIIGSTGYPFGDLESASIIFLSVRMSGPLNYLIGGTGRYLFYTSDGGIRWQRLTVSAMESGSFFDIESLYLNVDILVLGFKNNNIGYIVHQNLDNLGDGNLIGNGVYDANFAITIDSSNPSYNTGLTSVNAIWGNVWRIFIVGNDGLRSATILGSDPVFDAVVESLTPLYGVGGYSFDNVYHVVAVGSGVIRYTHNDGASWSSTVVSGVLRSVAVVNANCAIAVGDAGLIMYSIDGYATWSVVSAETLNQMGNGGIIAGVNFTNISATSVDKFAVSGTIISYALGTAGRTKMYHLYAPYFLNRPNFNVLEASGNMVVSGDIWIREAGSLRTNNGAFYLLPENTNDIYVGTAAHGNTNVRNRFTVAGTTQVVDLSAQNVDLSGVLRVKTIDTLNNSTLNIGPATSIVSVSNTNGETRMLGNTNVYKRFTVGGTSQVVDLSAQNVDLSGVLRVKTIDTLNSDTINIGSNTRLVNLGSNGGEVHILGNLFLPGSITSTTVNNIEIKNKTFLLNDESPYNGGSDFTGLYIRDNLNDSAGYFLTNGTRNGYLFKTAASPNRVNLDVSGLTLSGHMAVSGRGLLTLKPNLILDISADYTISTDTIYISDISMLDVSLNRRVWRNVALTSETTQVLDTKLASGLGLYAGKLEADFIPNSALDISGSAFATRLGLGTTGVNMNYQLDVSGNEYVSGNVDVSGNMSVQQNIFNYGTIYQW
jgi:photosystem II stability/assembly factor-like uncharacterized protein